MNVIDSSGWLEYFAGGSLASEFAAAIEDVDSLIVPSITLFEVHKRISIQRGEAAALKAVDIMTDGKVIPLDLPIALAASRESLAKKLPMADSIIYATALQHKATLWTKDADFEGLPGVEYRDGRG